MVPCSVFPRRLAPSLAGFLRGVIGGCGPRQHSRRARRPASRQLEPQVVSRRLAQLPLTEPPRFCSAARATPSGADHPGGRRHAVHPDGRPRRLPPEKPGPDADHPRRDGPRSPQGIRAAPCPPDRQVHVRRRASLLERRARPCSDPGLAGRLVDGQRHLALHRRRLLVLVSAQPTDARNGRSLLRSQPARALRGPDAVCQGRHRPRRMGRGPRSHVGLARPTLRRQDRHGLAAHCSSGGLGCLQQERRRRPNRQRHVQLRQSVGVADDPARDPRQRRQLRHCRAAVLPGQRHVRARR